MAQSSGKILEGIFAINKPQSLSSAQVLRDLQHKFAESRTFAPLLQAQESQKIGTKRRKRVDKENVFKMGHGGTLDPLATGVLIVGIGRGTKHLPDFLGCKKTYETVVLFGKSTTTYDVAGKVVSEAPVTNITKSVVEEQLTSFRGKSKQIPPIYSAIRIDGMKLYDYARSGKELPRELESRDVEVTDCTLLDFWEAGQHDFRYPAEHASEEEKATTGRLMKGAEATKKLIASQKTASDMASMKSNEDINSIPRDQKAALHTHPLPTQEAYPAQAPAARIRLTVSSGFYVRSFAHDLGISCGSVASMAALARTRQAEFTSINPVPQGLTPTLTYEDLEVGEDEWGPKISGTLERWMTDNPVTRKQTDDRDLPNSHGDRRNERGFQTGGKVFKRSWKDDNGDYSSKRSKRRNSSSPEG